MILMTFRAAWRLQIVLLLLLLIGTQMPNAWRAGIEGSLHLPWGISSWAHLVLFASMAWVASAHLGWRAPRILLVALALALLTEGLQYFAINRHPRLLDVGIDLAGAGLAIGLAWLATQWARFGNRP